MERSANIVDSIKLLTIFAKYSILGVSQGTSDKTKQKLGALSFISQKIGLLSLQISFTFKYKFIFTILPYGETLLIVNSTHVSLISN